METKTVRMEDIHKLEAARVQLHNFFEALHIDYNMYSDITQTMWKITHSHYFIENNNNADTNR